MNRHPLQPIGESDRAADERDGIVCLSAMFDSDRIAFMQDWVERAMAAPGPQAEDLVAEAGSGRFFGDLDIASRVMGASEVNFFYDQLLAKEPGTPWHQDQPYWAVAGRQVCSIWLPFDPMPPETCVEYVAGSHLWQEFSPYPFQGRHALSRHRPAAVAGHRGPEGPPGHPLLRP